MIVADLPELIKGSPLFLGGPVQPSALSFLHTDAFLPDANVMPNLSLGHSLDSLMDLGDSFSSTRKIKTFAGYAGWSPGQLEEEMKRNAWLTHPASIELVFETDPAQLWQFILRQNVSNEQKLVIVAPEWWFKIERDRRAKGEHPAFGGAEIVAENPRTSCRPPMRRTSRVRTVRCSTTTS